MHCFWWNNISVVPALLTLPNFFSLSLSPMQEFGYRWLSKDAEHVYWNFNIEALSWEKDNSFFLQGPEYHCIPDAGTFPLILTAVFRSASISWIGFAIHPARIFPSDIVTKALGQTDLLTKGQQDNKTTGQQRVNVLFKNCLVWWMAYWTQARVW